MNVFETCLPKRVGRRIYLPDDNEEEEEETGCFSCCIRTRYKEGGIIRLPEGRRTIDDYLDPTSPVSIEVLLAEQEEELDQYLHDDDTFIHKRKNSVASHTFLEEDAQFLSEHRISAILVDRPKLGSANIFQQLENRKTQPQQQELLDIIMPVTSTSTSSISSRVFAIKTRPQELISDALHITQSPLEIKQVVIPSPSSSTSSSIHVSPPTGSANSLSVFPAASSSSRVTEFPATMLTRSPYIPPANAIQQRRPSVVASLLGDKLDDFTEKLATIKKNIIKSLDSEDEEEELTENDYYTADRVEGQEISNATIGKWDNFVLPKFKNKSHAVPQRSVIQHDSSDEEDELFDFSVVGKNVRNFSEGVMGNGLRMLNNLSTRINKNQK